MKITASFFWITHFVPNIKYQVLTLFHPFFSYLCCPFSKLNFLYMKKLVSISMFMILATLFTQAQVSMTTSGTYSQDFNSLANTGTTVGWFNNSTLANWYAAFQTGTLSVYRPDNGSINTGSIYSYGLTGSTERALGSLSSGTPVVVAYGIQMQNNSAVTISNINVTYVGEQWRCGGKVTQDTLYFYYKISPTAFTSPDAGVVTGWTKVTALCFASPTNTTTTGPLDGNASANQTIFNNVSIPGINIPEHLSVLPGGVHLGEPPGVTCKVVEQDPLHVLALEAGNVLAIDHVGTETAGLHYIGDGFGHGRTECRLSLFGLIRQL